MNKQEQEQKHLEFATGDAMNWFRNVPTLTRAYVTQRLVDSITAQFRGHEIQLTQFEVKEINPRLFWVQVNNRAEVKLDLGREVSDGN